ncbi:MAG TPA: segregation/condensation protein A, partial [Candidatus Paceibacterota bacterium]|nr:segregation/condensation protein A [Candidatus Paceibacterota bacterium]
IYERMRDLSAKLKPLFGANVMFARGERRLDPVFSPDTDMTVANIFAAAGRALANLPKREFLPKIVVDKVISLEEMIGNLTKRVAESLRMSFREFSGHGGAGGSGAAEAQAKKVDVIVSFLAMLELVKQGIINVTQERHFDDIHMETEGVGVPKY